MTALENTRLEEAQFLDIVYDWMERAPWLAISFAAHVIVFLILVIVPWSLLQQHEETMIIAQVQAPKTDSFDPPVEEIIPPIEKPELPTDLQEVSPVEALFPDDSTSNESDEPSPEISEAMSNNPFDDLGEIAEIGIGGLSGTKGSRFRGDGVGSPSGSPFHATTIAALTWLSEHQAEDGSWDCDGFSDECGSVGAGSCGGGGESVHDVGVTGLALLAFLGQGSTTRQGEFRDNVARGVRWLESQQDPDTGLLGDRIGHAYLYNHAIGTLALCEAYYFSKTPIHRRSAQRAVNYISQARNPYGAWRYDCPPIGDNDASVTGWMVFALKSAADADLAIDPRALGDASLYFDEVTDPATGRTGYDSIGSPSSRITGVNDHFTTEGTEAMTAVALLSRIFMGEDPEDNPLLVKQADLLRKSLPDPELRDMYYWYYGTYAMYQMGGKHWRTWSKSLKETIVESQRKDGDLKGSWDPDGAWGFSGGRVYSTAMMTLSLQVYYRYSRVLGSR